MKRKQTITRLVLISYGAALLAISLLAGLAWHGMAKSLEGSTHELRSKEVLIAIEKIQSSMALAIAAHRGHLLLSTQDMLSQREAALETLETALDEAGALTRDNLTQQVLLLQVRGIVDVRKALLRATPAQPRDAFSDGTNVGAQLRNALSQMTLEEQKQLELHRAEHARQRREAEIFGALLLVLLAGFLIASYFMIARILRRDKTHLALEQSEALLRQILDLLPVGVFVVDRNGAFSIVNPAARSIWGRAADGSQDTRMPYPAWRLEDGGKVQYEEYGLVRAFQKGESTFKQEFEIEAADGQRRIIRSSAMPLRDGKGDIVGAIAVNMDLTDLKQTQNALRAAHDALEARVAMRTRELVVANSQLRAEIDERRRIEQTLRHVQNVLTSAQRVGRVGSWEINLVSREEQWSDEFFRICGLLPGSVTPNLPAWLDLLHPDDRDKVAGAIASTVSDGCESRVEARIVRPDGSLRHVLAQAELFCSGGSQPTAVIGSLHDITEQKQTEELLRQLAVHQERIKEGERKRIAREIHDEMGQNLLALRIDVSMLHARTAHFHPTLHRKVDTVLRNIDNTIKSVRAIINNLRPAVLDLGLHAAIQWQVTEFQRRSAIRCTLHAIQADHVDDLGCGLDEEQTTTLFRVLQESLTNVARHANARNVDIRLSREAGRLCMRIADDGVGIYPGERRKPQSFGLVGIRERINAIGGELDIDSIPGKGTILMLTIPLRIGAVEAGEAPMQQAEIDF